MTLTETAAATDQDQTVLRLEDVWYSYPQGQSVVEVLHGVGLTIRRGEFVALLGRSGSGKSTLLHIAAGLTTPNRGRVTVGDHDLGQCGAHTRALLRRRSIGFVFQFFYLLSHLRIVDNVALPLVLDGHGRSRARDRARELLDAVELGSRANDMPMELSGGEMQRVAIARALVSRPTLVLADEPTGNLDSTTAEVVLGLLIDQVRASEETSLLLVTHDETIAERADRVLRLEDGKLTEEIGLVS